MLIKDVLAIKPGSYIKGFKFLDDFDFMSMNGRRATFDLNCWNVSKRLKDKKYIVRTPWYIDPPFPVYDNADLSDLLKTGKYMSISQLGNDHYAWHYEGWACFNINEPVGIHLGTYSLSFDEDSEGIVLYTKILRNDGQVGFISLSTKNIEENELELL
jgi:hypothetical protein